MARQHSQVTHGAFLQKSIYINIISIVKISRLYRIPHYSSARRWQRTILLICPTLRLMMPSATPPSNMSSSAETYSVSTHTPATMATHTPVATHIPVATHTPVATTKPERLRPNCQPWQSGTQAERAAVSAPSLTGGSEEE